MSDIRVRYQTIEFDNIDIHLCTLRDNQQYSDVDGIAEKLGISSATWPLFGIIWPSSIVLANLLLKLDIQNKRILEVGCGIGLASLLLNHRLANITATDVHPEAGNFLSLNVSLNKGHKIPFTRMNWEDADTGLGEFDLIVGSDLLYEQNHAELLSRFIDRHSSMTNEVIIVDPGRRHHASFSKKMVAMGFSHQQTIAENLSYLDKPYRGQILRYRR